ncbi:MAG: ABC transporter ATP-binding protein [Acidobacteriota bacterium]
MNSLSAEGISFGYQPGKQVLSGLHLEVPQGSFTTLLGPNGSGKSTLLRILAGALTPLEGTVRIFGRRLAEIPPPERARMVAVLPQENRLIFPFTAREVVLMGRSPHLGFLGIPGTADLKIVEEAMHFTHILEFAGRIVLDLSAGERQRVFLARALAQSPRILLLDEPTAFLDLAHQVRFLTLLERLHRERGITTLAVSHDLTLAGRHGHHLILLHRGQVAAQGTPEEVLREDILSQVYGVPIRVHADPAGGGRFVHPAPS